MLCVLLCPIKTRDVPLLNTLLFAFTDFPRDVTGHHPLSASSAHALTAGPVGCQFTCACSSVCVRLSWTERANIVGEQTVKLDQPGLSVCEPPAV